MQHILRIGLIMGLAAATLQADDLRDLVGKAAALDGDAYWQARNGIVQRGRGIVNALAAIQDDASAPWKTQLMGGICRERIAQAQAIADLSGTNGLPALVSAPGPASWKKLEPEVVRRLGDQHLWFYCLEAMWKGLDDFPRIGDARKSDWEAACERAVEQSPKREWAVRILEDTIENDPTLRKNKAAEAAFIRLLDLQSRRSVPVLLKAWRAHGIVYDPYILKIMNLAGPEHVDVLEAFLRDPAVKYDHSEAACRQRVAELKAARDRTPPQAP